MTKIAANERPITVVTRDNIRTLKPHLETKKPSLPRKLLIDVKELKKIEKAAVFFSEGDMKTRQQLQEKNRDHTLEIAEERRRRMEEYDLKRSANAKLTDLEKETREKANHLLAKAQIQIEEQEDEIKHMNELMLYAKCVAVRDSQVEEKKLIQKIRKDEEARLDQMMEIERVNELKKLEEKEIARVNERRKGAAKIREQIELRHEAALLEQERRDQDAKATVKAIKDQVAQELRDKAVKIRAQRQLIQEVVVANQLSQELKKKEKLREEEEEKKILQYIIEKDARETKKEQEAQAKKAEREKELARLCAAQEKVSDKMAAQDALRARRDYEAYEREWRRKEKEQAEKVAKQEAELRAERSKQQKAREYAIALEAHKMKQEFFEALDRQKKEEQRVKLAAEHAHDKNKAYALQVQAQIKEKEILARRARQEFFQEGIRLANERAEKKNKIDAIKARKIAELEQIGVPQKLLEEDSDAQLDRLHAQVKQIRSVTLEMDSQISQTNNQLDDMAESFSQITAKIKQNAVRLRVVLQQPQHRRSLLIGLFVVLVFILVVFVR